MKLKISTSMGYAGTREEWLEDLPPDIDPKNEAELSKYLEDTEQYYYETLAERISVVVGIVE